MSAFRACKILEAPLPRQGDLFQRLVVGVVVLPSKRALAPACKRALFMRVVAPVRAASLCRWSVACCYVVSCSFAFLPVRAAPLHAICIRCWKATCRFALLADACRQVRGYVVVCTRGLAGKFATYGNPLDVQRAMRLGFLRAVDEEVRLGRGSFKGVCFSDNLREAIREEELLCNRDYSRACPESWSELGDGSCAAPPDFQGQFARKKAKSA
jgi:hypothetical protein